MRVYPIKLYLKKRQNIILLSIALVCNIASWGWLAINVHPHLGQVFLHYNILFGVDLVGPWYAVYALPLAGFLVLLSNAVLGWLLFRNDEFAAYVLHAISIFVNVMVLISTSLLVFLNV